MILGSGSPRRWGLLAAGGLAALAVGTWLSFPTTLGETPGAPALRVVLFDVSAGTLRRRPTHGLWARRMLREQALLAAERGEELALGVFAGDARALGLELPELWLERLEGRGGSTLQLGLEGTARLGSELDAGLALFEAELLRADRAGASLVLCAALDHSGPDPRGRLSRLTAAGVGLDWILPPPAELPDLALEDLRLPERPEPGAPLVARLELAAAGLPAGEAQVMLVIERNSGLEVEARPISIPPGGTDADGYRRWGLDLDLGPALEGRTHLEARVGLAPEGGLARPDPTPENDARSASCRTGERLLAGLLSRPEQGASLAAWLGRFADSGLDFRACTPAQLPGLLPDLDLVISVDLSPRELPATLLADHVRAGGSWLFCAGWNALPGWLPDAAAGGEAELAQLLPLVPASEDREARDVVFLVDGSGSMAGEPFRAVQEALARIVLAAPAADALRLQFFTGTLATSVDLRVRDGDPRAALERLFDARVPGGPTAILYSLEQYRDQRASAQRPALTFLLSDGKDEQANDAARRAEQVAADLSRGDSRLAVIAAGAQPERQLLERLVQPGEALLEARDLGQLGELFQREVFRGRERAGQLAARAADTGSLSVTTELLGAWGPGADSWPAHDRYLRCRVRTGADVLLAASESGEPLLAWQRVGSGLVAAWASSTLDGWAPGLRASEDLFGPLLRTLARRGDRSGSVRVIVAGAELRVSGDLEAWPAEPRAEIHSARWGVDPSGAVSERLLASVSLVPAVPWPGADPRRHRRGELPAEVAHRSGAQPLGVRLLDGVSGELLASAPLHLACEPELQPGGARRLEEPWVSPPGAVQTVRPEVRRAAHPQAWIWLLGGLVALFAAALFGAASSRAGGLGGRLAR